MKKVCKSAILDSKPQQTHIIYEIGTPDLNDVLLFCRQFKDIFFIFFSLQIHTFARNTNSKFGIHNLIRFTRKSAGFIIKRKTRFQIMC